MKKIRMNALGIAVLFLMLLGACENKTELDQEDPGGSWNLINVSGGFAGIDETFEKGDITWSFDDGASTLTVLINEDSNALFTGLPEGTYTYSILEVSRKQYLIIDAIERGRLTYADNQMVLNENDISTGSGADNFVFTFMK